MVIDWFTIAAQALNFLVLVWLMKRFLYKPVLAAIDGRERLVAKELGDAAAKMAEAAKDRDEFQQKSQEFDRQRALLLSKAQGEAEGEIKLMQEEAKKTSEGLRQKQSEDLRNEHDRLTQEIVRRTGEGVFAIARKALTELASTSLEAQMTQIFIERLRSLSPQLRDELKTAFKQDPSSALVRSTFDIPQDQQMVIAACVKDVLAVDAPLQFSVSPDLVSGIEFSASGQCIGWNIHEYLDSLNEEVAALLSVPSKP